MFVENFLMENTWADHLVSTLKELRKSKGYTQERLAEILQVTVKTYGGFERGIGMPNCEQIRTLSDLYEVSADMLLGRTESSQNLTKSARKIALKVSSLPTSKQIAILSMVEGWLNRDELEGLF